MKIMILGLGKSGTTALLYKLAAGLPNCRAFSGGKPGKHVGDYENVVYKHTYEERKGKNFELYREHLRKEQYDRKVWIARDPRDVAVSRMLYRWHRGYTGHKRQYLHHLNLVKKKERNPRSLSFYEICRYVGHSKCPITLDEVIDEEKVRYKQMCEFVSSLGHDWFIFTFEDMVAKRFHELNNYLGFEVRKYTEVPESTGKAKVIRKKATGDWRNWFTKLDIERATPVYSPYMELMGIDCDDWELNAEPIIEPKFSSGYMQSLPARVNRDAAQKLKKQTLRLFRKKAS